MTAMWHSFPYLNFLCFCKLKGKSEKKNSQFWKGEWQSFSWLNFPAILFSWGKVFVDVKDWNELLRIVLFLFDGKLSLSFSWEFLHVFKLDYVSLMQVFWEFLLLFNVEFRKKFLILWDIIARWFTFVIFLS